MSARTTAATAGTDTSTSNPPLDVLELGVDAGRVLSPALVAELDAFCDRLEAVAATGRAVGVLRLTGGAGEPGLLDEGVDVHLVSKWERVLRRSAEIERSRAPRAPRCAPCGPTIGSVRQLWSPPGGSTRITSAPSSASTQQHTGPETTWLASSTRMPSSGFMGRA